MPGTVQVIVHAGGPAVDAPPPSVVPARVLSNDGALTRVKLLGAPEGIRTPAKGDTVLCLRRPELRYPVFVTEQYVRERRHSYVTACEECGFPEAFDPPTVLAAAVFPEGVSETATFTTTCPLCEGMQMVRLLPPAPATPRDAPPEEIAAAVRRVVATHFDAPEDSLSSDRILADLGGDDLDALEIAFALEAHFVVCIPDERLEGLVAASIAELTARVQASLDEHPDGDLLDLEG